MCFPRKFQKFVIFLGKMKENKCFRSKYQQFPVNFGQIFNFFQTLVLMTKSLA